MQNKKRCKTSVLDQILGQIYYEDQTVIPKFGLQWNLRPVFRRLPEPGRCLVCKTW